MLAGDGTAADLLADAPTRSAIWSVSAPGAPAPPSNWTPRAPFRSAAGMMTFLKWERIDLIVDAADPFGPEISVQAATAARALGLPLLQLRPRALAMEALGAHGRRVATWREAAAALPFFGRVFLAAPLTELAPFALRRELWCLVRAHHPQPGRFPLHRGDYTLGAPPFTVAHERTLLTDYRISHVVVGDAVRDETAPLLTAAAALQRPVIAVAAPSPPEPGPAGARVATVAAGRDWLSRRL